MARYLCGLDLGQAADYTALVIAEAIEATIPRTREVINGFVQHTPERTLPTRYDVRHIERYRLGTPYPDIVQSVGRLLSDSRLGRDVSLVVDGTGVGRAVVDLFRRGVHRYAVIPVMITAGADARLESGWYYVPKRELVGTVQVLLQSERLRFAEALPETALLTSELQNFQIKTTAAANEVFNAREGQHDDLVLALALAVWFGERPQPRMTVLSYQG